MSVKPSEVNLDLSDLSRDPDRPYITQEFEIIAEGDIPGAASISLSCGEGVYLSRSEIKPRRKVPPFRAQAAVKIRRSSDLGTREIEITASGDGLKATAKLELSRSKVQISITEPKPNTYTNPGEIKIEGKVSPPIEGLIIHVDLYHKYPELKTPE